jgi:arginyl-tRNA synthetase
MATLQADSLQLLLNRLGVEDSSNSFPSTDVLTRPLDIYRAHLADVLVQLTDCEPQVAYDSILEPNDYGDLEVVIPKLRLKGSNPKELAFDLAQKVCPRPICNLVTDPCRPASSFQRHLSLISPSRTASTFDF